MELNRLEELLKKKGIGPQGSKSLTQEEVNELRGIFIDSDFSLVTKATMLTALLVLDPNEFEKLLLDEIKNKPGEYLPSELVVYLSEHAEEDFMNSLLQVIHRKDLSYSAAAACMQAILRNQVDDYLKASFLEAERLKRETFEENKAFFDVLAEHAGYKEVSIPLLIDICDAYDGNNRTMNFTPFIACTLASMGYPSVVHGVDKVAPKQGYTPHKMLKLAGKKVALTLDEVAAQIEDVNIGWGYVDQEVYFPALARLKPMRKEMVKRPFLATFEKLLQPIRAKQGNHIVTGYTHKHYRDEVPNQLVEQGRIQQALVMKGVEGSTALSMSRASDGILYNGKEITELSGDPQNYGVDYLETYRNYDVAVNDVLTEGLSALAGKENYASANIKYTVCLILDAFGLLKPNDAIEAVERVLNEGIALDHWNNHS